MAFCCTSRIVCVRAIFCAYRFFLCATKMHKLSSINNIACKQCSNWPLKNVSSGAKKKYMRTVTLDFFMWTRIKTCIHIRQRWGLSEEQWKINKLFWASFFCREKFIHVIFLFMNNSQVKKYTCIYCFKKYF